MGKASLEAAARARMAAWTAGAPDPGRVEPRGTVIIVRGTYLRGDQLAVLLEDLDVSRGLTRGVRCLPWTERGWRKPTKKTFLRLATERDAAGVDLADVTGVTPRFATAPEVSGG